MNAPSVEKDQLKITENETEIIIREFECLAEEVCQNGKLPNDSLSRLSNLLFLFRDFDKFEKKPSSEQLKVLYVAQKKLSDNIHPNDIPNITLRLLVNLKILLEAEIGRYRIISKLNNQ